MDTEAKKLMMTNTLDVLKSMLEPNSQTRGMGCCEVIRKQLYAHTSSYDRQFLDEFISCSGSTYSKPQNYIHTLFEKWPEFSGMYSYPVPAPSSTCSAREYYDLVLDIACGDIHKLDPSVFWTGEYGKSRIRLVEFLIEQITKDLETLQ